MIKRRYTLFLDSLTEVKLDWLAEITANHQIVKILLSIL